MLRYSEYPLFSPDEKVMLNQEKTLYDFLPRTSSTRDRKAFYFLVWFGKCQIRDSVFLS